MNCTIYGYEILFIISGVLDPEELFETLNIHDGKNGLKEASALPSESLAAGRIGECIARRSLAWDTAFFTSAGKLIYKSSNKFAS